MGTRTTCDGTGVPIPSDTPTTGLFGHQYSQEAREHAEAYLDAVDALHTESAQTFTSGLEAIRAKFHEHLLQLPDES